MADHPEPAEPTRAPATPPATPPATAPATAPATPPAARTAPRPVTAVVDAPATPPSTYGSFYYANYESGAYERNETWMSLFRSFARHIVDDLQPRTALDAGCAIGMLVEALRELDVEAWGIDISEYAISQVHEPIQAYCSQGSLTDPLPGTYDLITCIEVMEHLAPDDAEKAIANLCAASDTILFSSAPDDFEEPSHINLRPAEEWSVSFARHGFVRDVTYDATYVSPWAVLYRRSPATVEGLVRAYDRAHFRLYREVHALRRTAVELENQLDDLHGSQIPELRRSSAEADELRREVASLNAQHDDLTNRLAELAIERDDLAAQLVTAKTELLRLRDLLVGRDHELGGLRGRVAELESELLSYGDLPERYQEVIGSTTWRLSWKLLGPYRRVQTLRGGKPGGS